MKNIIISTLLILFAISIHAQSVTIDGYAYETGNRGYLNEVEVKAYHPVDGLIATAYSNRDGNYTLTLPIAKGIKLIATKDLFHETEHRLDLLDKSDGDKVFVKTEMQRAPGYIFEITLANKKLDNEMPVDAIKGAHIEVYNNTTKKEILNLKDHMEPDFKINLLKGNHYTLLIRKEGYLAKRLEAFVDVDECILCFEGIGDVRPDVADNLTGGNSNGTLLANVELDPLFVGKKIELEKIYYDLAKWNIREDAAEELDKVGVFLKDNPRLNIELGSHTDSRGKAAYNMDLSQKRAESAVRYLRNNSGIRKNRTTFKGYGETQLVNHCADGVDCTDEEHQQNRRTELKILGIQAEEEYKSLLRMKTDEELEKMIMSLSDEDQIRIPAGGEVPADLQKALNEKEQKSIKTKVEETIDETVPTTKVIAPSEDTIESAKDPIENVIITKATIEKPMLDDTKLNTVVEKEVVTNEIKAISEEQIQNEVTVEAVDMEQMLTEKAKIKEQAKNLAIKQAALKAEKQAKELAVMQAEKLAKEQAEMTMALENEKITNVVTESQVVETPEVTKSSILDVNNPTINSNLNGHMIVIHYANIDLPKDHKIYKKHNQVEIYKEKDFYYYLIGTFDSEKEASKFMKLYVTREYPNAYVMNFKNGVRLK